MDSDNEPESASKGDDSDWAATTPTPMSSPSSETPQPSPPPLSDLPLPDPTLTSEEESLPSPASSAVLFFSANVDTLLLFLLLLLSAAYLLRRVRASRRYPPGPWGLPFLGFVYVLGSPDKRRLFAELRAQHGDVFSFPLGLRLVVVVNGFEKLKQVFVHQGHAFLDRPQVFTFTHVGQGKGIVNSSGEVWREHRKFALSALRSLGIGKAEFADKVTEELQAFCRVLDRTEGADLDPAHLLQTAIANIVCSIAFGKRFDYDDPVFNRFLDIFQENMRISGGTAILNYFPFLRYVVPKDLLRAEKVMKNVEHVQSYLRTWLDNSWKRFDPNADPNDFIDAYFKEMQERKASRASTTFSYDQLLKVTGDLLVGGTETTGTTLSWFLVFLVRWPHVQRKMRQEIDVACPDRSVPPAIRDRRAMPYVEAAILECQRFADIAPFSVTHAASADTEVDGMLIPQGTIVIPNIHSVHFDADLWGDPENFRPERFLNAAGEVVKPDHLIPFFVGKRSCIGEGLARMELFLFIATILQRYEVRPPLQGKLPGLEGVEGITFTPHRHQLRFLRRDILEQGGYNSPKEEEGVTTAATQKAKPAERKINGL